MEIKWFGLVIFLWIGVVMEIESASASENTYRYVITETGMPTSFDPLDADNTNNLPVARMIYATPLEANDDNQISSDVLQSFKYDSKTHVIEWVVKKGLKFDDGSPLEAADVAFSIARMAYTRPAFPVLEKIKGIESWVKGKHPLKSLPAGIVVNGQNVSIHLSKNIEHPLFRFCLELFSIIPKRCVDLETNKISCETIPASGYYRITQKSPDGYIFEKRDSSKINDRRAPSKIQFQYISSEEFPKKLATIAGFTVVAGNEVTFPAADLKSIQSALTVKFTPASRFAMIVLNPEQEPFKSKVCRQIFARKFRESFAELAGPSKPVEASIFTKILPGYLSASALESENPISDVEIEKCKNIFSKHKIRWGYAESEKRSIFIESLKRASEKVGSTLSEPVVLDSRKELADQFADGKIAVLSASSGFWALDPAGDMKMFLTPNLHKALKFSSSDKDLQKIISTLGDNPSGFTTANKHLFKESQLNIYTHLRRFFATSDQEILSDVPFAITSPAPWQVFRVK